MDTYNTGVVLIDAPTGAGKTQYIKQLGAMPSNTLTSEQLIDKLLEMCRNKGSLDALANSLRHIYYIENMESLRGKEETQRLAAQLINIMSKQKAITLTGIDCAHNLPFFLQELGPNIQMRPIG